MVGSSMGRPRSGSALLLLFIFQAAYNFDLWLRSPIVYDIAPMKEVLDDLGHGGGKNRNSRTAIVNVSCRFFILKSNATADESDYLLKDVVCAR